jgi:hypothetical protein
MISVNEIGLSWEQELIEFSFGEKEIHSSEKY